MTGGLGPASGAQRASNLLHNNILEKRKEIVEKKVFLCFKTFRIVKKSLKKTKS